MGQNKTPDTSNILNEDKRRTHKYTVKRVGKAIVHSKSGVGLKMKPKIK